MALIFKLHLVELSVFQLSLVTMHGIGYTRVQERHE